MDEKIKEFETMTEEVTTYDEPEVETDSKGGLFGIGILILGVVGLIITAIVKFFKRKKKNKETEKDVVGEAKRKVKKVTKKVTEKIHNDESEEEAITK